MEYSNSYSKERLRNCWNYLHPTKQRYQFSNFSHVAAHVYLGLWTRENPSAAPFGESDVISYGGPSAERLTHLWRTSVVRKCHQRCKKRWCEVSKIMYAIYYIQQCIILTKCVDILQWQPDMQRVRYRYFRDTEEFLVRTYRDVVVLDRIRSWRDGRYVVLRVNI